MTDFSLDTLSKPILSVVEKIEAKESILINKAVEYFE
jgi:hypothetical protein